MPVIVVVREVEPPTVALALAALHVPPLVVVLSVVVLPAHTLAVPVMEAGKGFTVIPFVVAQPVGSVYVMVALPAAAPLTTPVLPIAAVLLAEELHAPPPLASVSVAVLPWHTELAPVIVAGNGFTVAVAVV